MFLKILILVAVVSVVWFGFRYMERVRRMESGARKPGERSMAERLRKSMREKTGAGSDPDIVEDTEKCRVCGAFVSVDGVSNCGKPNCPY